MLNCADFVFNFIYSILFFLILPSFKEMASTYTNIITILYHVLPEIWGFWPRAIQCGLIKISVEIGIRLCRSLPICMPVPAHINWIVLVSHTSSKRCTLRGKCIWQNKRKHWGTSILSFLRCIYAHRGKERSWNFKELFRRHMKIQLCFRGPEVFSVCCLW